MLLPHNAWVVVADGQKHLVLINCGEPDLPDLRVHLAETSQARLNAETGADRPGRVEVHGGRRAAVEQTDWKTLSKASFGADLAASLNSEVASGGLRHFVLIADPRTLGVVRSHLTDMAMKRLLSEIPGDLNHQTIAQIEQRIMAS